MWGPPPTPHSFLFKPKNKPTPRHTVLPPDSRHTALRSKNHHGSVALGGPNRSGLTPHQLHEVLYGDPPRILGSAARAALRRSDPDPPSTRRHVGWWVRCSRSPRMQTSQQQAGFGGGTKDPVKPGLLPPQVLFFMTIPSKMRSN